MRVWNSLLKTGADSSDAQCKGFSAKELMLGIWGYKRTSAVGIQGQKEPIQYIILSFLGHPLWKNRDVVGGPTPLRPGFGAGKGQGRGSERRLDRREMARAARTKELGPRMRVHTSSGRRACGGGVRVSRHPNADHGKMARWVDIESLALMDRAWEITMEETSHAMQPGQKGEEWTMVGRKGSPERLTVGQVRKEGWCHGFTRVWRMCGRMWLIPGWWRHRVLATAKPLAVC